MENFYFDLLKTWCDGMLAHQLKDMGPAFDGALLCPACRYAHARCDNAVYPFLYMADATGDTRYVDAAIAVEKWQREAAFCDDGSCYNDTHASWAGITVFSAVALCEALERHSSLLPASVKAQWEEKLAKEGQWLRANLDGHAKTNINYLATNACALALVGKYLGNEEWMAQAKHLARYALARFTEHGLLWGEGQPWDKVTARGCRPIDIGYNVEESVPSLIKYAVALGDEEALDQLTDVLRKQLFFFLPDGGWDNSFGSRNNKWTYYGSRTSDGCCAGYALLAGRDPRFAEVAHRNLKLMEKCTWDGLLAGGPDYEKAGEYPCIHHTFTHANALTAALDAGIADMPLGAKLPLDEATTGAYTVPELGCIAVNMN